LVKKLPVQPRHAAIGNEPDENFHQTPQVCLFPFLQLQGMLQRSHSKFLKVGNVDWNFSLKIANGYPHFPI
jgi:hypothetical protein